MVLRFYIAYVCFLEIPVIYVLQFFPAGFSLLIHRKVDVDVYRVSLDALADETLREAAARMREDLRSCGGAKAAADFIEEVAAKAAKA